MSRFAICILRRIKRRLWRILGWAPVEEAPPAPPVREDDPEEANPISMRRLLQAQCLPYLAEHFPAEEHTAELVCAKCDNEKAMYRIGPAEQPWAYLRLCTTRHHSDCLRNEYALLQDLRSRGFLRVPEVLAQKDVDERISFSLVTALQQDAQLTLEDDSLMLSALEELREKTTVTLPFEESDFYRTLRLIDSRIDPACCSDSWGRIGQYVRDYLAAYAGQQVTCAFAHRDVKSDNYYVYQNQVWFYDLEGSRKTYPQYFDFYYYFLFTYGFQASTIEKLQQYPWYTSQGVKEFLLDLLSRSLVPDTLSAHFHKCFVYDIFELWPLLD